MLSSRWTMLSVLFVVRTATAFQFQSVAAVSPLLVRDLALDLAQFGALIGAWMLPGVFLAVPSGMLGGRFGDRRGALAGLVLMVLGGAVTAAADEYSNAVVGRIASGTGAVLLTVLLAKMAADWFGERNLATAMGILVVSWPLGIGLAFVVLGPVAEAYSWKAALHTSTGVCAAALLLMAAVYRDAPQGSRQSRQQSSISPLTRKELGFASLSGITWATYNTAYIILVSFTPLLLADRGLRAADAAIVASAATWPLVLSIPLGGVMADKTGRGEAIMHLCFVTMAVTLPLMLFVPSPVSMLAFIALIVGPAAGIIMSLPARALRPESRGLGMGIYYTWYYLAMALLPGVAGWCREASGVAAAPLLFASLLLVVAIGCAMLFRRLEARR